MPKKHDHITHLKKNIHVPLFIGLVACIYTWVFFGIDTLVATILSWLIGITLVATLIGAIAQSAPKN